MVLFIEDNFEGEMASIEFEEASETLKD